MTFPLFTGKYVWDDGAGTIQLITVTGSLTTDTVIANFQNINSGGGAIESAYVSVNGTVTIIASAAAADGDVIGFVVFRSTTAIT